MTSAQIIIVVTIVLYLAAMVFVGVYFGKKGSGSSSDDFYLGGRKMGPVVTAMSAEASDMSSYLLMGLPGLAYLCGLPEVTWTAIGLAIGTYLNWLIVARRLRRYSAKLGAITIPDFFARRFGDKKHLLSCIAAVQAPLIMMSQNRQEAKDRARAENDYKINLKSELIIDDLHKKLDLVLENQKKISRRLDRLENIGQTHSAASEAEAP